MATQSRRNSNLEWFGLALLLAALVAVSIQFDWLWRWDRLLYDAQARWGERAAPRDVVIVGIDDASLSALGRWPWRRDAHAKLIRRLTAAGARAIALDLIFAEPHEGDPAADAALVQAVAHAPVVLPVFVEASRIGGTLHEQLPFPALAEAASGLGHVDIELDQDGIARSTFLKAGLGESHWPTLAAALLTLAADPSVERLRSEARAVERSGSPYEWVRARRLLIPFAGPPGHFARVSYIDALTKALPAETFRDKLVLVGTTAVGLGDAFPTPVSGHGQFMPGVELNANVMQALRLGIEIRRIPKGWHIALAALLTMVPLLLYARVAPRIGLVGALCWIVVVLSLSAWALATLRVWFPPTAVIVATTLSYPLWSWRRLESALRYLGGELSRSQIEQEGAQLPERPPVAALVEWLHVLMPGRELKRDQNADIELIARSRLTTARRLEVSAGEVKVWLGNGAYSVSPGARIEPWRGWELEFFSRLDQPARDDASASRDTVELVERRIEEVRTSMEQVRQVRTMVDGSLRQMADGVLVVSNLGQILLANQRSAVYLLDNPYADLVGRPLLEVLGETGWVEMSQWTSGIVAVFSEHAVTHFETASDSEVDLLVQLSPLTPANEITELPAGVIVNLADISALKNNERRRAELMSFLSHDLRSPLVSLLALAELAAQREKPEELRGLFERATRYTQDSLELLDQFLELTRAESSAEIRMREVDLLNVSMDAIEQTWAVASAKQIEVEQRFLLDEAFVSGEPALIERALVNLLNNALKYSPVGSKVELRVRADPLDPSTVCVQVADGGYGIAETELPVLFDRFSRVGSAERSGERGTGLGLAFVKAVADRHGHPVEVQSAVGAGLTFTLRFDLAATS